MNECGVEFMCVQCFIFCFIPAQARLFYDGGYKKFDQIIKKI